MAGLGAFFLGMKGENAMSARVIEVIEVKTYRGEGVEGDPVRTVTQFWSLDGKFLADNDGSCELELTDRS